MAMAATGTAIPDMGTTARMANLATGMADRPADIPGDRLQAVRMAARADTRLADPRRAQCQALSMAHLRGAHLREADLRAARRMAAHLAEPMAAAHRAVAGPMEVVAEAAVPMAVVIPAKRPASLQFQSAMPKARLPCWVRGIAPGYCSSRCRDAPVIRAGAELTKGRSRYALI